MNHKRFLAVLFLLLACSLATAPAYAQAQVSVLAGGLQTPVKIILTPAGNLLVAEGGNLPPNFVPNQGRISLVDRSGARRSLIEGLPSGLDLNNTETSGPSGLWLQNRRTLFVIIGQGDTIRRNATGQEAPNPNGLSSAIFSSLLKVQFSEAIDELNEGFALNSATDYVKLADGLEVELENQAGEDATLRLVADFRDLYPAKPAAPVSGSNPFGIVLLGDDFFIPDAGQNSLLKVRKGSARTETIVHFPPVPNTRPFGPPVSQAVPNSVYALSEDHVLVTLLSGFPFGLGAASVRIVNVADGTQQPFITGLTTAIDVVSINYESGPFYVLEFASNFGPPFIAPGRLLRFETPSGPPTVVTNQLTTPTSMAFDSATGEVFITEINTGRIIRVRP